MAKVEYCVLLNVFFLIFHSLENKHNSLFFIRPNISFLVDSCQSYFRLPLIVTNDRISLGTSDIHIIYEQIIIVSAQKKIYVGRVYIS